MATTPVSSGSCPVANPNISGRHSSGIPKGQHIQKEAISDAGSITKRNNRRAPIACGRCRARKVRCDVVNGPPCSNCRWEGVKCLVLRGRRKRPVIDQVLIIPSSPKISPTDPNPLAGDQDLEFRERNSFNGSTRASGYSLPFDLEQCHRIVYLGAISEHQYGDVARFPSFFHLPSSKLLSADVEYLRSKGALNILPIPLQSVLVQCYIEYVHPYMPILELDRLLSTFDRQDGSNGQISLILYQAIMFAAAAFVDMEALRRAGYGNRQAARKQFFNRARVLYECDYESDRLVLIQSLLLMTYWYETPTDDKDGWHWMGVAVSLALSIGLHQNPIHIPMTQASRRLRKRIWWTCFMRDQLMSLEMKRPTRIKIEDFNVPILDKDDFPILSIHHLTLTRPMPECVLLQDLLMQEDLATMCISMAKLCICISLMIKAQYSFLISNEPKKSASDSEALYSEFELANIDNINQVEMKLMAWAESLPDCCQYRTLSEVDIMNGKATIAVQRTMLHMMYYTTVTALHRPQFLRSPSSQKLTILRSGQEMSRSRVRGAALHITRMCTELCSLHLERLLPTTCVTVMLSAMITQLLELRHCSSETRKQVTQQFRQYMCVKEKLREMYPAAEHAANLLDSALRTATNLQPDNINKLPIPITYLTNTFSANTASGESAFDQHWLASVLPQSDK